MTDSKFTPKTKKSPVAGYILLSAIALEIGALVLGGFVVALFGLVAFVLGVMYIVLAFIYDPDTTIASLNKVKRMSDEDGGAS